MIPPPEKRQFLKNATKCCDLSFNEQVLSELKDIAPCQLGKAVTELCAHFVKLNFQEVVLSPFTSYPIDYLDEIIDVPGIGQLRFNTEPEIWEHCGSLGRFFSTSTLFRKEKTLNLLRRSAFSIVDFYQPGSPESMVEVFKGILKSLANRMGNRLFLFKKSPVTFFIYWVCGGVGHLPATNPREERNFAEFFPI